MFEAAGLDPEAPPETWEEFAEYAVQLTGDGQYGLAIADNNTVPMWPILLWGNGGGVVSDDGTTSLLDAPETIEALDYWGGLVRDDGISPIGLGGADADNLFQTERAAMEIVGPWMTTGFTEAGIDFGLAPPPAGPAGPVTLGTSVAFAINAESDDATAEAAKEFIKFWNTTDSQITWSLGSGFPPSRTDIPADALAGEPVHRRLRRLLRHRQVLLDQRAELHRGQLQHLRADAAALPQRRRHRRGAVHGGVPRGPGNPRSAAMTFTRSPATQASASRPAGLRRSPAG